MSRSSASPFDLRSGAIDAVHLVVKTPDFDALRGALRERFESNPEFFDGEAVAIDLRRLPDGATIPVAELADLLRSLRTHPLGVVAGEAQREWATVAGLPLLDSREPRKPAARAAKAEPAAEEAKVPAAEPAASTAESPAAAAEPAAAPAETATAPEIAPAPAPSAAATVVVDRPLRSGQRAYSRGDLVVYGMVSHGAEVMADGHVHIYGALRGRALAGARGNTAARIFCTSFDPELVAVAGIYRTAEQELPPGIKGQPAVVRLDDDEQLRIEPLALK